MKRRAILELVCKFRKNRDHWRKLVKECEEAFKYKLKAAEVCLNAGDRAGARALEQQCAGVIEIMKIREARASVLHTCAHDVMWLLKR